MLSRPLVLCILDGVGWGRRDSGDAVHLAQTPVLDRLMKQHPWCLLQAHGTAVGMPSDKDMGNSEVGHNAMGAGRVFDQGAKLVELAIRSGKIWASDAWKEAMLRSRAGGCLHLIGLLSDGRVHSHVDHLDALIDQAIEEGAHQIRIHFLTDGRDVAPRSALRWVQPLEERLRQSGVDARLATGGGRMHISMDRYQADWPMVERGWRCHVQAQGRRFDSATEAIKTLYSENPDSDDQWLPSFVVADYAGMKNGDSVLFFNFRGDRAIELSQAFESGPEFDQDVFDRGPALELSFAGMMEYDGDLSVPTSYLVEPPAIEGTVSEIMASAGLQTLAVAETQKFGHVTFFFNGNRSDVLDGEGRIELPSDILPFDQRPEMKASEATDEVIQGLREGARDFIRVNLANGDMVGHTGNLEATIRAIEVVDQCLERLIAVAEETEAIVLITADHGNAEQMYALDKKSGGFAKNETGGPLPYTSHTLNRVPFIVVDPQQAWELSPASKESPGIAQIGASLLALCSLEVPKDYLPALVQPRTSP
jgi:2,3-bisphosphoglycerate-independent phosphoglycerate mutase